MPAPPRFARRLASFLLLCGCLCPPAALAEERTSSYLAALESITLVELKQHVDYLAADALEGREAGRPGGRKAGDYLSEQLAELGLRGAGVGGGYFQPFAPNFRNVLALIPGGDPQLKLQFVLLSAHYDHVGYGTRRNSRGPVGQIHNGADDNASGTSGLLELAEALTLLPEPSKRSILIAFWDAEEKGLLGSKHWAAHPTVPLDDVAAVLNMDMIGWLRQDHLLVFGTRSGYGWRRLISRQNEGLGLLLEFPWTLKPNSDHYPFFQRDVPVLLLHTGPNEVYHSPRDDADRINHAGMGRVVRLLFHLAHDLANRPRTPRFREAAGREGEHTRERLAARASRPVDRLGAGWEKRSGRGDGVRITRILWGSPAHRAKLRTGDRIVRFAGREIHTGEDLSSAVMTAESPAAVVLRRPGHAEPKQRTVELQGKPLRLGITWRVDDAEPGTIILTHVVPGSPAARAGLRAGDRVYQVGGQDFDDQAEFAEAANALPDPIELQVERQGRLRTVEIYVDTAPPPRSA